MSKKQTCAYNPSAIGRVPTQIEIVVFPLKMNQEQELPLTGCRLMLLESATLITL